MQGDQWLMLGGRKNARPTIGLLISSITDARGLDLWTGVAEVARARGSKLICFPCGTLHTAEHAQDNILYDLASAESVDGLVLFTHADAQEFADLRDRYSSLPLVNVLQLHEGYPGVVVDNHLGIRDLVGHLIDAHGYRQIAFIRGPEGDPSTDERYHAYADVLAEHGFSLDLRLVVPGDLHEPSGEAAIELLLDRRGMRFEALVSNNDSMARGAIEALRRRGIRVPYDMAVVGYDDMCDSRFAVPSLTTVSPPMREMGRRAAEALFALMQGEQVPDRLVMKGELVVRQSCGCLSREARRACVGSVHAVEEPIGTVFAAQRERILADLVATVELPATGVDPGWAERLLDAFSAELRGGASGQFLSVLAEILPQVEAADGDLGSWQGAVSVLRRHGLAALLRDSEALSRAEDLWGEARVYIGEAAQRAEQRQRALAGQQAIALHKMSERLLSTVDIGSLVDVLVQELPRFGITGSYLALYDVQDHAPADGRLPEWSRLVLAFGQRGSIEPEPDGHRFLSRQLLPEDILLSDSGHDIVVEPLYFQSEQIGFALFEIGPRDGGIYDALRGLLSSALKGTLILGGSQETQTDVERRVLQLQTAADVSRAASSILDPDELIQQVVNLVRRRFDLYYTGLFLVDERGDWTGEPGRWAVLRAGTGASGRQMVERGHKLEIGGASMIGQCVSRGAPRIALDVGEEAVRFENPLLPATRSELALPLISRGQVLGAMTVQSSREAAFSEADVAALQTMADQLAIAVQNAHLFAEVQESAQRVRTLYETSRVLSSSLEEEALVRAILESVSEKMGCEYAIIFTVDETTRTIGGRRGLWRGKYDVFPEWIESSSYSLDDPDILCDVYRRRRTEVIDGWDERFNRVIWEKFGHERLLRVFMPIDVGERVIGVIEVGYEKREKSRIDDEELRLLTALIDQSAVALENARLLEETQRALRETEALNAISNAVSRSLQLEDVLKEALDQVLAMAELGIGLIALRRPESGRLYVAVQRNLPEPLLLRLLERGLDGTLCDEVYQRGEMLVLADLTRGASVEVDGLIALGLCSYLGVPLASRGEVLGAICVFGIATLSAQPALLSLMQAVGHQVGVAVENARLFEQTQRRARELVVLNELGRSLSARRTAAEVLAEVHRGALRLLDASNFYVALYDPGNEQVTFPYDVTNDQSDVMENLPADQGVTGYIIRNRTSVLIEENVPERLAEMGIEMVGATALSWLGVPILIGEQVLGVMCVQSYTTPRAYSEHDRELLEALASQTAIALQNARLLEEAQRHAERERVIREISDDIRAAVSVDDAIQRAIRQLGRALDAAEVVARIGPETDLLGPQAGELSAVSEKGNGHG